MTPPASVPAPTAPDGGGWRAPGALVLRMILVAWLAIWVAGGAALWVVTRASGQEAVRHVVRQQTDEVEVVARLLAGK
ncbi:UNVERIFIED_CONTAM: sensor domain-containing diguanylate cyclase, partial [Salmonella enterica subsp. enterica serovar Weltevreden]